MFDWNKVEELLQERHWSVYKLGKLADISDNTLRNYKHRSEPSFTNACKIADTLGVSLDELRKEG